ncbi:alpha/beta fold hydrolase [Streptomyces sp. NBC_00286]|uniref:alpha/beta fold hydrolase n=1 Tax=Streptomyces sp. NBC_00286 TaxID=2975701 RepID=UPI002E2CAECD|nr:alpha/beta fold hydrolase [Streptomyces sp. NBC_00286]
MVTVLFVHGTGVREPSYSNALARVREGVAAVRPDVRVEPCDWGSALGSYLRAEGASIPGFAAQGGQGPPAPDPRDEAVARWALLYADPFAELELFALTGAGAVPSSGFVPGPRARGDLLLDGVSGLDARDTVRGAWADAGLGELLTEAATAVRGAPAFRRAIVVDGDPAGALPRLTARALVAYALSRTDRDAGEVSAKARDELVDCVTDALGGDLRVVPEALTAAFRFSARLFENVLGSRLVVARRTPWSGRSVGFFGDIVRYLVRGEAVRAFVAEAVRAQPGPVVLLGHSLGGIAAFDLLASGVLLDGAGEQRAGSLPQVEALITVGSQAPLLYELDALPSRPYGSGLPSGFPRWVNVYDRRDLLSYTASEVFGSEVTDVEVDNRQPVSAAHSAYWTNDRFHSVLHDVLDQVSPP